MRLTMIFLLESYHTIVYPIMHWHGFRDIWLIESIFFTYDGVSSTSKRVKCGVPHGSI